MHWHRILFAVVVLGISACSSKFERVDAEFAGLPERTIGILPVNFIEKPSARVDKNLVKFAGTLGRAAVVKAEDAKRRKLTEGLASQGYVYQQDFDAYLQRSLDNSGLMARPIVFRRSIDNILEAVPPGRFEKRYPEDMDVDFLLDIYVEDVGFVADGLTADYLPVVHLGVRVVDADTLETRYQKEVQYNPESEPDAPVLAIKADPAYAFKGIDALLDNPAQAKVALSAAVHATIDAMTQDIAR